jgi:hypothetical protein
MWLLVRCVMLEPTETLMRTGTEVKNILIQSSIVSVLREPGQLSHYSDVLRAGWPGFDSGSG